MKGAVLTLLLFGLTACKIGQQQEGNTMTDQELMTFVNQALSGIEGTKEVDCANKPDSRVKAMACLTTTKDGNELEYEITKRFNDHLKLQSAWVHEYTSTAHYLDDSKKRLVNIIYTPQSQALGTSEIAQGGKGLIQVVLEDNPFPN